MLNRLRQRLVWFWLRCTNQRPSINEKLAWQMSTLSATVCCALTLECVRLDIELIAGFSVHLVERSGITIFPVIGEDGSVVARYRFYLESPDLRRLGVELSQGQLTTPALCERMTLQALKQGLQKFPEMARFTADPPVIVI